MENYTTVLEYIARCNLVEKLSYQHLINDPLKDDFVSEIYLILSLQKDKLEGFREQPPRNLRNYLLTIIKQQYFSTTSDFHVRYRKKWRDVKTSLQGYDVSEDGKLIKPYVKDK